MCYVDVFVQGGVHGEPAWGLVRTVSPTLTPSQTSWLWALGPRTSPPWVRSTTLVQKPPMYAPEMQDTYM
jgi:hypothetical protein